MAMHMSGTKVTDSCFHGQVDATFLLGHSNSGLTIIGAPAQKVSVPDLAKMQLQVTAELCEDA